MAVTVDRVYRLTNAPLHESSGPTVTSDGVVVLCNFTVTSGTGGDVLAGRLGLDAIYGGYGTKIDKTTALTVTVATNLVTLPNDTGEYCAVIFGKGLGLTVKS